MAMGVRDRPTPDLIVICLTGLVVFVVGVFVMMLLVAEIWRPETDLAVLTTRIAAITNTLIGAIVGYLAGRGFNGKSNGNGK